METTVQKNKKFYVETPNVKTKPSQLKYGSDASKLKVKKI